MSMPRSVVEHHHLHETCTATGELLSTSVQDQLSRASDIRTPTRDRYRPSYVQGEINRVVCLGTICLRPPL